MNHQRINSVCTNCGIVNAVPTDKNMLAAKCGKCKSPLVTSQPVDVPGNLFYKILERNQLPVVVDFWAPWCGPCKMMGPHFTGAAAMHQGKVLYIKLNTENESQVASTFNIRSIPTMALFQKGKEVARTSGAMDERRIHQWVSSNLV